MAEPGEQQCQCWTCVHSNSQWRDVMFPSQTQTQTQIQVGQRLGLPFLRSLQPQLLLNIASIPCYSLSLTTSSSRGGGTSSSSSDSNSGNSGSNYNNNINSSSSNGVESQTPIDTAPVTVTEIASNDIVVTLSQDGQGVMAISGVIWDCGLLTVDFLSYLVSESASQLPCCMLPFRTVLDVGCGTGVCGIGALYLGADHVSFTDSRMCDALENNLDDLPQTLREKSKFISYSWDNPDIPPDLTPPDNSPFWDCLLCSDLLYESKSHSLLVRFLTRLPFKYAIFAYKKRHDAPEEIFFEQLESVATLLILDVGDLKLRNLTLSSIQGTGLYLVIAKKNNV